uniref:Tensin homolog n=1 Tax=Phallusia mammillata TaxID=59560 RepID=A0A6F9DW04_9ASCI|nr:tensin homolog [Phallusia mammillata]
MKNHRRASKSRPLSFPSAFDSLASVGPSSPIETTCCRCRRAKSVNTIFPPNQDRQASPKRSGHRGFPKFSWSVFKNKQSERTLRASSSQNLKTDSKPTSWTFMQWTGNMAERTLSQTTVGSDVNKTGDYILSSPKQAFVMSPISSLSASSSLNSLSPKSQSSTERRAADVSLRKFVLNRDIGTQTPPQTKKRYHVPRSPGPLDGSLYTQVKKSRRVGTDESDDSHEKTNLSRNYHSADELSAAATLPMQRAIDRKSSSGSNIQGYEMKDKNLRNPVDKTEIISKESDLLLPPVTSQAFESVDLLRDVTQTSLTVTTEVVMIKQHEEHLDTHDTVDGISDEGDDKFTDNELLTESEVTTVREVPPQTSFSVTEPTDVEVLNKPEIPIVLEVHTDLESNDAIEETEDQSKEEATAEEKDMENLQPTSENHLSQVDVDNVMALVNECLADTEAHSVTQPDGFQPKHDTGFSDVPDLGPTFSPQQPDYPTLETDVRFEEKGPEYALPVRDVVLTSIPARKAILVTSTVDDNNSNNARLLESGGYSTIDDLQTNETPRAGHKNSLDSGHSVGSAITTNLHVTMSNSDVDSGIDGSATVISTSSDVRLSPTLDRSTVASTTVTSSSYTDVMHDVSQVRVHEMPLSVESKSECVGTGDDFVEPNETSATQYPEPVIEYIPAPKEAEIQIIHIKNVFADQNNATVPMQEVDRPETAKAVQPETSTQVADDSGPMDDELEEEERRMQEEIENTRKKLLWLEEQRIKMKKKKEDAAKRHSFTISAPVVSEAAPQHVVSATLPRRPPAHVTPVFHPSKPSEDLDTEKISEKERQDIDDLLRSVQELDFTIPQLTNTPQKPPPLDMAATAMPPEHHPHFHETSPGFKVADPRVAERAVVFTPAYAHPMHQPQHIPTQQQQIKLQEEKQHEELQRRRREEERDIMRRQMEQEKLLLKRRERHFLEQEEKRKLEREKQDKFQIEFENKQKLVRGGSVQHPKEVPLASQLQQQKKKLTTSRSSPLSSVTSPSSRSSSVTSPSTPLSTVTSARPQETRPTAQDAKPELGPDLQSQLDELDRYIAQLTNVADMPVESSPVKTDVVRRRRRSFSIELERRIDPSVNLTAAELSSPISNALVPPRPPSRTRSSYDSVSRRLSHGFELAQVMRQNSIENEAQLPTGKEDDVFESPTPVAPQPSYPPKSSLTRPAQQQIIARPMSTPPPSQKKSSSAAIEEQLSPELFLAMSINPGGRPVENIHSYKEDLEPHLSPNVDIVDAPPATPGFPNVPGTPATPYVNTSPGQAHVPAGLAKTPLAALGLKPKEHPEPAFDEVPTTSEQHQDQVRSQLHGATKPQTNISPMTSSLHFANGISTNTSQVMTKDTLLMSSQNRLEDQARQRENVGLIQPGSGHGHISMDTVVTDGYPEQFKHVPQNGWANQAGYNAQMQGHENGQRSPWVYNGDNSSPIATTPNTRSPVVSSLGPSLTPPALGSGGVSPSGTRSLTGSNDSLLSDGSASGRHPHPAYQQQQRYGQSNPPLPPKDSSRHSGSSIRSTSTAGSGYLGGTSQTSPHSAGSPVSSTGHYPFAHPANKRESQLSAYDRQLPHGHHMSSDDGGLSSPTSGRTSSSSISDIEKLTHDMAHAGLNGNSPPKFIKDTTSYWYKPDITRDQALAMLRDRAAGSFVVRDSRCYPGAFGLALKVHEVPQAVIENAKPGTDMNNELVRHFLIEPSSRGVKLKGCANEPVFGSLSALIYQHSITPLALPCKLTIPSENMEVKSRPGSVRSSQEISNSAADLLRQGAACNVLYLGSADTESLTGPEAIERAMREVTQNVGQAVKTSVVHFKVSAQGITLTDNARKIFFRRHYPTSTLTHCGIDPSAREPHNRRWDATAHRGPHNARVFGFVAKKTGTAENSCHLFAEIDMDQPAPAIVNFINKILLSGSHS